jgi:hypothetical protein
MGGSANPSMSQVAQPSMNLDRRGGPPNQAMFSQMGPPNQAIPQFGQIMQAPIANDPYTQAANAQKAGASNGCVWNG